MIDTVKITVCGGKGGNGLITFRREKFKPKGPPMGGSGGKGGDVYLIADTNTATLKDFASSKIFRAQNGGDGGPNDRTGKCADDLFIKVPVGTTVKDNAGKVISDLDIANKTLLVAKGGAGGRGNAHMGKFQNDRGNSDNTQTLITYAGKKFSREKHIYYAERGLAGETAKIGLELKLIADAGIVGLPNAGKSSLLNALTKTTKATTGSYPFTTLEPNLGVVSHAGTVCILADIPGIIEGAHLGKGLGERFLKHIERTKLIIHIISIKDIRSGARSVTRTSAYKTIRDELYKWDAALIEKPEVIVINKIDLAKDINALKKIFKNVTFTSALTGEGVFELKGRIIKEIIKQREKARMQEKSKKSPTPTFTMDTLPNRKMVFQGETLKKETP